MLRLTAEPRRRGELALLFVSNEPYSLATHLKQTIREYGIDFPVLFYGDGPKVANREWNVSGNPIGFLIDPQGVIVAKGRGRQTLELAELAAWILEHGGDAPRARLRTAVHAEAGPIVQLEIELSSPQRRPLLVQVDYVLVKLVCDAEGNVTQVTRVKPVQQGPELEFNMDCGAWGETVHQTSIDLTGYQGIEYEVRVLLPGTESARNGEGFWVRQRGWYYFDGDNVNGEKN